MKRSHFIRLLAIPALVAGMAVSFAAPASAQSVPPPHAGDVPSVGVAPVGTKPTDPDGGQWFFFNLDRGARQEAKVHIVNPADVPQTVHLFLADLKFSPTGAPGFADKTTDVGTWGGFSNANVVVS